MPVLKLADILNRECPQHPGTPAVQCRQCAPLEDDPGNTWHPDRRDETELLAQADSIRQRFPLRFATATTDHPEAVKWVGLFHNWIRSGPSADPPPSLLLMGATGTGKTHIAYAALAEAIKVVRVNRAGYSSLPTWRAYSHADLCGSLRPGGGKAAAGPVPEWLGMGPSSDSDPESRLDRLRRVDLLVVDDLGAIKATEWVEEATYRLINSRYEGLKPSIFTTNLSPPELAAAAGDRITSRLVEMCIRVVLDGPDRRKQHLQTITEEPT